MERAICLATAAFNVYSHGLEYHPLDQRLPRSQLRETQKCPHVSFFVVAECSQQPHSKNYDAV